MSSDLTFLTNESGNALRDRFSDILKENARFFDCLVGYFFISGFYKLYPALEAVLKENGFIKNEDIRKIMRVSVRQATCYFPAR
jgi:hypothetical protein